MKNWIMAATVLLGTAAFGVTSASAHGCHREPHEGKYGWHRHVGPDCERVEVTPRYREYREHHHHHQQPPSCVKKCHYVGPFKECETICR